MWIHRVTTMSISVKLSQTPAYAVIELSMGLRFYVPFDTKIGHFSYILPSNICCETTDMGLVHWHCVMCLFTVSFADTDCTFPQRDGQAELTWKLACRAIFVLTST